MDRTIDAVSTDSAVPPVDQAPRVGVLALQGDVREHLTALTQCGARAVLVRRPAELAAVDAIVLPGGESTTMSRLLQVFDLLEPLRARLREGLPAFGSCAGMILLADEVLDTRSDAEHLSGIEMTVRRNAFGRQVDSFETDLEVDGLTGGPIRAVFIRAPWVERVGPQVRVLATVPHGPAAGRVVAVRSGDVLATAFHPEVTGDVRLHQMFLDVVQARRQRLAGEDAPRVFARASARGRGDGSISPGKVL